MASSCGYGSARVIVIIFKFLDLKTPFAVVLGVGEPHLVIDPRLIVVAIATDDDRNAQPEIQRVDDAFDLRDLLGELISQIV